MPRKRKPRIAQKLEEIKRKANPKAVKYLSQLLEQAEEGKLTSLVVVTQIDGEHLVHGFVGLDDTATRFKFLGVLDAVKMEILLPMVTDK
jgi:hypothetical protein